MAIRCSVSVSKIPMGVESTLPEASGLGFLPIATRFNQDKALYQIEAIHERVWPADARLRDPYGGVEAAGTTTPMVRIQTRNAQRVELLDGAIGSNGRVWELLCAWAI